MDGTIHEGWNTKYFDSVKPAYNKYRWTGSTIGACRLGEVSFNGLIAKADTTTSTNCTPKLKIGLTSVDLNVISYKSTKTATISLITPRYGKVSGNELITIAGTNFVAGQTSVTIDGIVCTIVSVTATEIKCTSGVRLGDEPNPSFIVKINNQGLAATQGNTFTYVQYWSEASTWGNDAPP